MFEIKNHGAVEKLQTPSIDPLKIRIEPYKNDVSRN